MNEGAFGEDDLARRHALSALLFRLESSRDPAQVVALAGEVPKWFACYPGFSLPRPAFAEMPGGLLGPLAPDVRVPQGIVGDTEHAGDTGRELEAAMTA